MALAFGELLPSYDSEALFGAATWSSDKIALAYGELLSSYDSEALFGAATWSSDEKGPYGRAGKTMRTEKNVFYGDQGSLSCS